MTKAELDRFEELASKATPGPWACTEFGDGWLNVFEEKTDIGICANAGDGLVGFNGQFIAAANPSTVLSLIAEIRKLRGALAELTFSQYSDDELSDKPMILRGVAMLARKALAETEGE